MFVTEKGFGIVMLSFDEDFFKGEEIEGFYVKPLMKRCWAASMELLSEIDKICKRHGIVYFADWGTLLGAVRHGGYIPWDDDMDISMTRENYEKFLKVAPDELPDDCKMDESYSYLEHAMRVWGWKTVSTKTEHLQRKHGYPYVVGIDIFVIDNIPDNKDDVKSLQEIWKYSWIMANSWNDEKIALTEEQKEDFLEVFEEVIGKKLDRTQDVRKEIIYYLDRLAAMYYDLDTEYGAIAIDFYGNDNNQLIPREYYTETVEIPFYNMMIPAPKEYEKFLAIRYGDWRTPVRGGADHEYPYFKDQIEVLREEYRKLGYTLPKQFDWVD